MSSPLPFLQLVTNPAEGKEQPMQPNPRPCVYQERKTHCLSPVAHKLKLCVRLLCAGMLLNTIPQHTAERLFLWPGSKPRAMEHPLLCGVTSSDPSKPGEPTIAGLMWSPAMPTSPLLGSQLDASAQSCTSAPLHPQLPLVLLWPCPW